MKQSYTDIYLVDCENVGLRKLKIKDTSKILVYYFTSNAFTAGSLEPHEREIHVYHNCKRDALDFIIDTKLGHLLCYYGRKVTFHIISYDKGFDNVCRFWELQNYKVVRSEEYIENVSNVDCFKLRGRYNLLSSNFSIREHNKLRNVYTSWFRSKRRDYDNLKNQILRTFYSLSKEDIILICDYCYYVGLEVV